MYNKRNVAPDLDLLVPAIHLSLENIDDLSFTQQHLLLLMKLLFQSLQKLKRRQKHVLNIQQHSKRFITFPAVCWNIKTVKQIVCLQR